MEHKKLQLKIQFPEDESDELLGEMSGELKKEDLVEFGDFLEAASESLKGRIQSESTLTIELTGQVRRESSAAADVGFDQVVVFKVAGGQTGERTSAMKLVSLTGLYWSMRDRLVCATHSRRMCTTHSRRMCTTGSRST